MDTLKKVMEINTYLLLLQKKTKEVLEKYTKLLDEIKYHIQTINAGKPGEYDKDYMKIKFNSYDDLPLNKILTLHMLAIIVRSGFEKDGKYYPKVFLDGRIDVSEEIDIKKINASKECHICHYWYFLDKILNYEPYLCNYCHDLMQKSINFNNVAIVSIKGNDYKIHLWYMSKDDAMSIMSNSTLNEKEGHYNFFYYV